MQINELLTVGLYVSMQFIGVAKYISSGTNCCASGNQLCKFQSLTKRKSLTNTKMSFLVESVLRGYHEYKDNWPEGSNFASASARG